MALIFELMIFPNFFLPKNPVATTTSTTRALWQIHPVNLPSLLPHTNIYARIATTYTLDILPEFS